MVQKKIIALECRKSRNKWLRYQFLLEHFFYYSQFFFLVPHFCLTSLRRVRCKPLPETLNLLIHFNCACVVIARAFSTPLLHSVQRSWSTDIGWMKYHSHNHTKCRSVQALHIFSIVVHFLSTHKISWNAERCMFAIIKKTHDWAIMCMPHLFISQIKKSRIYAAQKMHGEFSF